MLTCRACSRRTTIAATRTTTTTTTTTAVTTTTNNFLHRITATENRTTPPSRAFATQRPSPREPRPKDDWGDLAAAAEVAEQLAVSQVGRQAVAEKDARKLKLAVTKELKYTKDPFHIAAKVIKMLESNDFEKALTLTRAASGSKQVVVSWNHLIRHQFREGRIHAAIKLFNEMKKRQQLPSAQTFTIIFKGCAESDHPKQCLSEALKIYNAMLVSTRLQPNTTHLNAVLDACARAQDLESLFVVLRSAGGSRSPDNLTYTIIFNALRYQRSNYVNPYRDPHEQEQGVARSIKTTVSRAKMVWYEVIDRWKKGEIMMDEELMCAMGRLLLLGGAKETDSILGLVCEVLGITKLMDGQPGFIDLDAQKLAKPEPAERPGKRKPVDPSALEDLAASGNWEKPEEAGEYSSSQRRRGPGLQQQQQPQQQDHGHRRDHQDQPPAKAPPSKMGGNNTLSLVMIALAQSKRTKLAGRYWDYLTLSYGIVPDRRNYRDYIDCLSTGVASGRAARVLLSMPTDIATGNLYRRGLLLCLFDNLNENAFDNATTIYDAMAKSLRVPDVRSMDILLSVAVKNSRKFEGTVEHPRKGSTQVAYGRQILAALDRVWEPLRRATNELGLSDATTLSRSPQEALVRTHEEREDILKVAKNFVATSDRFLSQALIPKTDSDHKVAVIRRRVMALFIERWLDKQHGRGEDQAFRLRAVDDDAYATTV